MSERACAVRHSHILSRKFPPFLGFLSVADRTTNETKCSLYECALREIPRLPVCRSRGTAAARKRQNDLLSGCQNCALTWRAARRKNCRHCASVPVTQTRRNRDRMCNRITAHARRYDYHLVRASPRHPASVRKCSMWLPVLFRFLVDSLATLGHRLAASGITSRMLSVIPVLFFWG